MKQEKETNDQPHSEQKVQIEVEIIGKRVMTEKEKAEFEERLAEIESTHTEQRVEALIKAAQKYASRTAPFENGRS